jgi:signal transduction histidine kinase
MRKKLMLGMAVVAAAIMLLAASAGYGFFSHYKSAKITDKKVIELDSATRLIGAINNLEQSEPNDDIPVYLFKAQVVRGHLGSFRESHARTVQSGYDPDAGEDEDKLSEQLERQLQDVEEKARQLQTGQLAETTNKSEDRKRELKRSLASLRNVADHLRLSLINDIQVSVRRSIASLRQSIWLGGFALVWSILLVGMMFYYFRVWIFSPIRELHAGVQRVHAGNFSQPIRLANEDELQELAEEFNAMVARLHAVYADLARQVNERSRQLVRSERMVSVGFLAAGVAHEINNPLASILFCSEALERRLHDVMAALAAAPSAAGSATPAEAEVLARYLKMIQQEALRCKDITQKLLDFSRTGDRRKEPADLTGLIRGVLEVARHLPSSRGKSVTFEPTGYVAAPVNAQDLKSVILNLVVNALDSMEDGGRLAISLATDGGSAEMTFADTGCGMTPEVLQNIFEPFYTKSRTGKGTGLGLFISHQIVDQHGGTITATSAGPGQGSTFTVRIPLQLPEGEANAPPEEEMPRVLPFPNGNREAA